MSQSLDLGNTETILFNSLDVEVLQLNGNTIWQMDINPVAKLVDRTIEQVTTELTSEITNIGNSAFYMCENLTKVVIPTGVTSIGTEAFYGCKSLTNIVIPSGVTSIMSLTFYNCLSLTEVIIPEGVTTIGGSAFERCSSLHSLTLPSTITSIDINAFLQCTSLTEITILATTPPTLSTELSANITTIYVPSSAVSAYQTAEYWADLNVTYVGI